MNAPNAAVALRAHDSSSTFLCESQRISYLLVFLSQVLRNQGLKDLPRLQMEMRTLHLASAHCELDGEGGPLTTAEPL